MRQETLAVDKQLMPTLCQEAPLLLFQVKQNRPPRASRFHFERSQREPVKNYSYPGLDDPHWTSMKLRTKLSNLSKGYQNQKRNISTQENIYGFRPSFYKPASSHRGMA